MLLLPLPMGWAEPSVTKVDRVLTGIAEAGSVAYGTVMKGLFCSRRGPARSDRKGQTAHASGGPTRPDCELGRKPRSSVTALSLHVTVGWEATPGAYHPHAAPSAATAANSELTHDVRHAKRKCTFGRTIRISQRCARPLFRARQKVYVGRTVRVRRCARSALRAVGQPPCVGSPRWLTVRAACHGACSAHAGWLKVLCVHAACGMLGAWAGSRRLREAGDGWLAQRTTAR